MAADPTVRNISSRKARLPDIVKSLPAGSKSCAPETTVNSQSSLTHCVVAPCGAAQTASLGDMSALLAARVGLSALPVPHSDSIS